MVDGLFPPYGEPGGPAVDDASVLAGFARGDTSVGHSDRLHVEGQVLLVHRDVAAAIRIGPNTVLVRADLPDAVAEVKAAVEQALGNEGLALLDEETPLATPISIQLLGVRMSTWDLWGTDIDEAFAAVRAAAVGEEGAPAFVESDPPTWPW